MRALLVVVPALLVLSLLAGPGSRTARADEAPQDESAASKAYRDAWWAETGGGNLTQALDLYAKAVEAEGPAGVKARALYRRAIVLQRIGKTEEALRALERLAKDFPGEAQLNADARARLAEWTAVDLRSSFGDWFKRYQYSPEFQAKVIDLVLRLGSNNGAEANSAEQELLTIGDAAVPALREHVRSKNAGLQQRALKLLLMLGIVPDEIADYGGPWVSQSQAWKLIVGLPEERRAALRARVGDKVPWLAAALTGPEAVVAWLETPSKGESMRYPLFSVLTEILPKESPLRERLAGLALAPEQDASFRSAVAWWAREHGYATPERVRAWAAHDAKQLREAAWRAIGQGNLLPPAEGWPLVLDRLEKRGQVGDEQEFNRAFFTAIEAAPWPQDLERAAKALAKAGGALNSAPDEKTIGRERYIAVLSRVFETTPDDQVALFTQNHLQSVMSPNTATLRAMAGWARTGSTRQRRAQSLQNLVSRADRQAATLTDDDFAVIVELLVDPSLPADEANEFWGRVFQSQVGTELTRRAATLRSLLDRLLASPASNLGRQLVVPLRNRWVGPEPFLELLLAAPERTPPEILQHDWLRKPIVDRGQEDRWRKAWRDAWPKWNAEQRSTGIGLLRILLGPASDPATAEFLRERLRARPSEVPVGAREAALLALGKITWEDIRSAYDLTKVEEVDVAARWLLPRGNEPALVEPSAELFTALKSALRPDAPPNFASSALTIFGEIPAVHRELAALLLAHRDASLHKGAVELLSARASPEDEDLWLKALKDARVDVRVAAAKGMERVPTEGIKRALVGALDDPHPDVRAAALASLDAIQKMEDLKARWRERVK